MAKCPEQQTQMINGRERFNHLCVLPKDHTIDHECMDCDHTWENTTTREAYQRFKARHWGVVYGRENQSRAVPYAFPTYEEFVRGSRD